MKKHYMYERQELIDMLGFDIKREDKVILEYNPKEDVFWFIVERLDTT